MWSHSGTELHNHSHPIECFDIIFIEMEIWCHCEGVLSFKASETSHSQSQSLQEDPLTIAELADDMATDAGATMVTGFQGNECGRRVRTCIICGSSEKDERQGHSLLLLRPPLCTRHEKESRMLSLDAMTICFVNSKDRHSSQPTVVDVAHEKGTPNVCVLCFLVSCRHQGIPVG